jgi:hypothetical protein
MGETTQTAPASRYTREQLERLYKDDVFQKRFGADPELNALMNPVPEQDRSGEEDLQSLGPGRRIMGVDVPPAHLGHLRLLTMIGNEVAKEKSDWSRGFEFQLRHLTEALFVLRFGAAAVVPFAAYFRWRKVVEDLREPAQKDPALMAAFLNAELKAAEGLAAWDTAVLRFAEKYVRIEPDCNFIAEGNALIEHVTHAFDGFGLFPTVNTPKDPNTPEKKTASGVMQNMRLRLSRVFVRFAHRLLRGKSAGRSR